MVASTSKVPKTKKYTKPSINHKASAPALKATLEHCEELEYIGVIYSVPKAVKEKHTVKVAKDAAKAIDAAEKVSKERFEREPLMRSDLNSVYVEPEKFCLVKLFMEEVSRASEGCESPEWSETTERYENSERSEASEESETSVGSGTSQNTDSPEASVTSEVSDTPEGTSGSIKGSEALEESKIPESEVTSDEVSETKDHQKWKLAVISSERVAAFRSHEDKSGRIRTMCVGEEFMVLGEDYHFDKGLSVRINALLEEAREREVWLERSRRRMRNP